MGETCSTMWGGGNKRPHSPNAFSFSLPIQAQQWGPWLGIRVGGGVGWAGQWCVCSKQIVGNVGMVGRCPKTTKIMGSRTYGNVQISKGIRTWKESRNNRHVNVCQSMGKEGIHTAGGEVCMAHNRMHG